MGERKKSCVSRVQILSINQQTGPHHILLISHLLHTTLKVTVKHKESSITQLKMMKSTRLAILLVIVLASIVDALKFGIASRLFPQRTIANAPIAPTVNRNLGIITVDQSRQLIDVSDADFKKNVLDQQGLTVVLFTR